MAKTPSKLENEFRALMSSVGEEIRKRVVEADRLLSEAEDIACEHGIPFETPVSPVNQCYVPVSFHLKFDDLDPGLVAELADMYSEDIRDGHGWKFSEIC